MSGMYWHVLACICRHNVGYVLTYAENTKHVNLIPEAYIMKSIVVYRKQTFQFGAILTSKYV